MNLFLKNKIIAFGPKKWTDRVEKNVTLIFEKKKKPRRTVKPTFVKLDLCRKFDEKNQNPK